MTVEGEVFLVRHGETAWNAEGRFQGALDSPLTARGVAQARRVGVALAAAVPRGGGVAVAMHVSPLGRARRTAEIVAACGGDYAPPVPEPRLREISLGAWDGLTMEDVEAGWPGLLDGATRYDWYFRAPGGEGYDAALARVRAWLAEVRGPVVAVGHGLLGRLVRGAYLDLPREEALVLPVPQDVIWHLAGGAVRALPA